jgi:hypothetical protein
MINSLTESLKRNSSFYITDTFEAPIHMDANDYGITFYLEDDDYWAASSATATFGVSALQQLANPDDLFDFLLIDVCEALKTSMQFGGSTITVF